MRPCEGAPGGRPSWPPGRLTLQAGTGLDSSCHCIILCYPKPQAVRAHSWLLHWTPLGRPPGSPTPVSWAAGTRALACPQPGPGPLTRKGLALAGPGPGRWPVRVILPPCAKPSCPHTSLCPVSGCSLALAPSQPNLSCLASVCCNFVPGPDPGPAPPLRAEPSYPPHQPCFRGALPNPSCSLCVLPGWSPFTPTKPRCLCLFLAPIPS